MKPSRPQLVNLLIGKSILETLFAGALAVIVWTNAFPPTFHGWGEAINSQAIAGWVVNNASPWERVEVQLFIDGKLYVSQVAQLSRPDIVTAGWAKDEWHGYNFAITGVAPGPHEARVYALHRSGERMTLQLLGDPIPFAVDHR
ncbi:MAG TPA: hypothetical protein VJ749_14915 [Pyrinomonadaceae bacterium]|jgi:hypothetical protein|nr:hypothetical protein [Pyrinomonadaceae bacterium]